jgi:hypothetical protein
MPSIKNDRNAVVEQTCPGEAQGQKGVTATEGLLDFCAQTTMVEKDNEKWILGYYVNYMKW